VGCWWALPRGGEEEGVSIRGGGLGLFRSWALRGVGWLVIGDVDGIDSVSLEENGGFVSGGGLGCGMAGWRWRG